MEEKEVIFEVRTDEEFFQRFKDLGAAVSLMGGMFQNEGMEVSASDFREWNKLYEETLNDLRKLNVDSNNRLVRKG